MDWVFGTNGVVDAIDRVPEQFREMYSPGEGDNEGKHVLQDVHKAAAAAIDGFNATNRKLRKEVDGLKAQRVDLTPWLNLGGLVGLEDGVEVTPDALREKIEGLVQQPGQSKANFERMKRDLEAAHAKALSSKDGELTEMSRSLSRYLIDSAATAAIAGAKGSVQLLLPHIKNMAKVVKEDGDFQVRVVDEAGNYRGGATGSHMTITELVAELRADPTFGRAFESEARQSAAGNPTARSTVPPQQGRTEASKMTSTEKISFGLAKRDAALGVRR